jgi:hypothetical protein
MPATTRKPALEAAIEALRQVPVRRRPRLVYVPQPVLRHARFPAARVKYLKR